MSETDSSDEGAPMSVHEKELRSWAAPHEHIVDLTGLNGPVWLMLWAVREIDRLRVTPAGDLVAPADANAERCHDLPGNWAIAKQLARTEIDREPTNEEAADREERAAHVLDAIATLRAAAPADAEERP